MPQAISGCSKSNEDLCKEDPIGNYKNCLKAANDQLAANGKLN